MVKKAKNPSVSQILFVSYLVITAPTAWFSYHTLRSIDDETAFHVNLIETGKPHTTIEKSTALQMFGAFLRNNSAPFTKDKTDYQQGQPNELQTWTESRHNAWAALIYFWILFLIIAAIMYLWLASYLQGIFKNLANAIANINNHHLTKKNEVEKPFDLSDIPSSLESLDKKISRENEQQLRFLQHISHEIKTPLTSIKEGSKLLDEQLLGHINDEQQEITNILVRSSNALQEAIEKLLDYNVSVAPKPTSPRNKVDLKTLIRKALKNNKLFLNQKNLKVEAKLEKCHAYVDQDQILSVFDNLISNAIKHSPIGSTLRIRLKQQEQNNAVFLIRDQGPGVSEFDKRFIFQPFYVGYQAKESTLKGTGLGLSIAKQYTIDHGGELSLLESRKGAIFRVILPINQADSDLS